MHPVRLLRRIAWWRRINKARAWQEAARREAAAHNEAVRRIIESPCAEYRP
jgi:hypothetical protein